MKTIQKLSAGAWVSCIAAILALVSVIVYGVNISSAGYFQNASVSNLVLMSVLAIVMYLAVIVLGQIDIAGAAGKVIRVVSGVLQIIAPVLLTLCLINLISARVEGLGFIYFSNADVILEVQTPENLASASGTIASMVCFAVAMLAGMVSAFFSPDKKRAA